MGGECAFLIQVEQLDLMSQCFLLAPADFTTDSKSSKVRAAPAILQCIPNYIFPLIFVFFFF